MILKYYNENADVVATKLTNKDIQKFLDDYFEAAQRLHLHPDRDGSKIDYKDPASIAVYNTLTDGLWQYNGPLNALASIHQLHIDQAAKAQNKKKSVRDIIKEEES